MRNELRGILSFVLAFNLALSPLAPVGEALALEADEGLTVSAEEPSEPSAEEANEDDLEPAPVEGEAEGAALAEGEEAMSTDATDSAVDAEPADQAENEAAEAKEDTLLAQDGQEAADYEALQAALNAGGTVALSQDVVLPEGSASLTVPSGVTATLDLNGKSLIKKQNMPDENGTIIVNEGTLTITDSAGGGQITGGNAWINAGGIKNSGELTFAGGTLTGNHTNGDGGGIYNTGSLTITGGAIDGNYAQGSGGAIYNTGTVAITGGSLINNTSRTDGGGVYNEGSLALTGGTITSNRADGNCGGIDNNGSLSIAGTPVVADNTGGKSAGIYLRSTRSTITVTGALGEGARLKVTNAKGAGVITLDYGKFNNASPRDYFQSEDANLSVVLRGGEVYLANSITSWKALQDAIKNSSDETYLVLGTSLKAASNESAIQIPSGKNIVLDLNGFDLDRGLTKEGSAGHVIQMKGSSKLTVQDSTGDNGKICGGWSEHGGGINLESSSTCIIKGGIITKNHADYGGGIYSKGKLTLEGGRVVDNEAEKGAGIYNDDGTLSSTGGEVFGNLATKDGGGIYNEGTLKLSGGTIKSNTAKHKGGGIYFDKKPNEQSLANVTITENLAFNEDNGDGGGAGFYLQTGTVTMKDCEVSFNEARDGGGGYVTNNTTLNATNTLFKENKADDPWYMDGDKIRRCGGAILNHGTVKLDSCTVDGNYADYNGGGICSDSDLTLDSCTVQNNSIWEGFGGGIYVKGGKAHLEGVTIKGNSASKPSTIHEDELCGGGIANEGTLECVDCTITGNTSYDDGGGIYNKKGNLTLTATSQFSSSIADNSARGYFSGNGGGVYVKSGTARFVNQNVTNNAAKRYGGGIYCESGGTVIFADYNGITGNKTVADDGAAGGEGGGVYMRGTMNASGAELVIKDNTGAYNAYDLYLTNDKKINAETFELGTEIGVATSRSDGVITNGYKEQPIHGTYYEPSEWFFVSGLLSEYYEVTTNGNYQAVISPKKGEVSYRVSYYNPLDGKTRKLSYNNITLMSSSMTELKTGWYVIPADITTINRLKVNGNVYLLLMEGARLNASKGITVEGDNSLTIWGETKEGTGRLLTDAFGTYEYSSAIGGTKGKAAGTITFNGGTIEARGAYGAAAIGGGNEAAGGKVTINYGSVSARCIGPGAGIGSGGYIGVKGGKNVTGGTITITGGTVDARGGSGSAGIGGGRFCHGGTITITGGTVSAHGGSGGTAGGAGIGGGIFGDGGTITISGGHVTATTDDEAVGIGAGGSSLNGEYDNLKGDGKVILDYTSADMSVTAKNFSARYLNGGTLTLKKPFKNANNETQIFEAAEDMRFTSWNAGEDEDRLVIESMAGVTIVPTNTHLVTFDTDGAGKVAAQVVEDGACAQRPADPSKEGLIFIGWRLVTDGQMSATDFDFSTPITGPTLLKAFFVDPSDLGRDRYEIVTRDGAPVNDSGNMVAVVNRTLSQDEFDAGYHLLLVSSPLAEVPAGDKTALESKAKTLGATPGAWFDVSLYKVQGEEQTKLSKAGTPVDLEVTVPEALRKSGRTFYLLRFHDGNATLAAQGTGETLTWATDEFSTYLIAYKDAATSPAENKANGNKSGTGKTSGASKTSTTSSSSSSKLAKTGDTTPTGAIAVALACGILALAAGYALRRRNEA